MKEPMTQYRLTTTDRAVVRMDVSFSGRMQEPGLSMPSEFGYGYPDLLRHHVRVSCPTRIPVALGNFRCLHDRDLHPPF